MPNYLYDLINTNICVANIFLTMGRGSGEEGSWTILLKEMNPQSVMIADNDIFGPGNK